MTIEIKLNTDSDGFISQECPACAGRFKVRFEAGASRPVVFCPYCRHQGKDCWWTRPQASYIESTGMVLGSHELDRMMLEVLRGSDVKLKREPQAAVTAPSEPQDPWPVVEFPSKERVKHDGSRKSLYCPVTGREMALELGGKYQDQAG
jgi:hypothetical protein